MSKANTDAVARGNQKRPEIQRLRCRRRVRYDDLEFGGPMQHYVDCPVCEATNPLEDDAKQGDEIYCSFCNGPLILKLNGDKLRAVEG